MIGNGKPLQNESPHDVETFRAESAGWPLVPAVAVCPNPLCWFEEPVDIELRRNVDGVFRSQCGICGAANQLFERQGDTQQ